LITSVECHTVCNILEWLVHSRVEFHLGNLYGKCRFTGGISCFPTFDSQLSRAKEYLEAKATELQGAGIDVATAIGEGAADEKIIEYASQNNIDIIIMSIHGHGGLKHLLLGSVTDRVVRSGEKAVLVVPAS